MSWWAVSEQSRIGWEISRRLLDAPSAPCVQSTTQNAVPKMNPTSRRRTNPVDAAFRLLADETRRDALALLSTTPDGVASLSELADAVTARSPAAEDREQASIRLHHVVLPQLADAGVVDYDPRSETVRYYGEPALEALLDSIETGP